MNVYEEFWSWFAKRAPHLNAAIAEGRLNDVIHELNNAVDSIDPLLAWEIGPGKDREAPSFTISAEGDPKLRTTIDTLFRYRPTIPGWQLFQYRQRKPPEKIQSFLNSQDRPIELRKSKIALELSPSRERVNISFRAADFEKIPEEDKLASAFSILDALLGEEIVETRVGQVEIRPHLGDQSMALFDLPTFLDELTSN
jgi:hypothetical protein